MLTRKQAVMLCALLSMEGLIFPQLAHAEARIIGGTTAPNNAYPFIVSIEDSSYSSKYCGGTLITTTKVLTAAHCIDSTPSQIRVGTNNALINPGQVVKVSAKLKHPKYNDVTTDYDVAILTLAAPVKLSDTVSLVELPEACSSLTCITGLAKPGTVVRTIGWGDTMQNAGTGSDNLRQVDVPIVANSTCSSSIVAQDPSAIITSRMLCAGYAAGGKDTCQGDSGGPLFGYLASARAGLQTGIVSWGVGCGSGYGVYTRISNPEIRSFIKSNSGA